METARDDVEVTYVMNPINLDVSDALVDIIGIDHGKVCLAHIGRDLVLNRERILDQ